MSKSGSKPHRCPIFFLASLLTPKSLPRGLIRFLPCLTFLVQISSDSSQHVSPYCRHPTDTFQDATLGCLFYTGSRQTVARELQSDATCLKSQLDLFMKQHISASAPAWGLDEVRHIHWHLIDLCGIEPHCRAFTIFKRNNMLTARPSVTVLEGREVCYVCRRFSPTPMAKINHGKVGATWTEASAARYREEYGCRHSLAPRALHFTVWLHCNYSHNRIYISWYINLISS